jgi:hypothetical protein
MVGEDQFWTDLGSAEADNQFNPSFLRTYQRSMTSKLSAARNDSALTQAQTWCP